jgi:hypothetical protein
MAIKPNAKENIHASATLIIDCIKSVVLTWPPMA